MPSDSHLLGQNPTHCHHGITYSNAHVSGRCWILNSPSNIKAPQFSHHHTQVSLLIRNGPQTGIHTGPRGARMSEVRRKTATEVRLLYEKEHLCVWWERQREKTVKSVGRRRKWCLNIVGTNHPYTQETVSPFIMDVDGEKWRSSCHHFPL